jgi:DNA-binding transcriptional LysR family regulator
MLDPNQLRYFQAVGQHRSLSAAARALHVSQPALSQCVKSLERQLGEVLLTRSARGVILTDAGERLARHAARVLAAIDACAADLRGIEDLPVGHFVLGCERTLASVVLPPIVAAIAEAAPEITLGIDDASSAEIRARVLSHEVQVGIVADVEAHPSLVIVELFSDEFAVRIRDVGEREASALERLEEGPVVRVEGIAPSDQLVGELEAAGIRVAQWLPCGDLELAHSLVAAGIGAGILPSRIARYRMDEPLIAVSPSLPTVTREVSVIYRADMHRTRGARLVKDAAVAHGRQC